MKKIQYDDGIRKVEVLGDTMKYTLVRSGLVQYLTYSELLFQILTKKGVSPGNKRRNEPAVRYHDKYYFVYEIACAVYDGFLHSLDTLDADLALFKEFKRSKKLDIDHAMDNRIVSTRENLSLMPSGLNRSKSDISAQFRGLDNLYIAYCDGEYRVCLELNLTPEYAARALNGLPMKGLRGGPLHLLISSGGYVPVTMSFLCKSPEDLVSCLKSLKQMHFPGMPEGMTMYSRYKENEEADFWAQDSERVIKVQRELAAADRGCFQLWIP